MADLKMVEVGTDKNGNSLYNVRDNSRGGELVTTDKLTESEALSMIMGSNPDRSVVNTEVAEPAKKVTITPKYKYMSKLELEAMMRTHGVELDRRKSKKALLEEAKYNYLYSDENDFYFMNPESFEQINIKKKVVGERGKMLSENLQVTINFHNDKPISINLPNQINCVIETTDAALKGQTVSSSYKPATLDIGINIQVPPFIESGDKIILDTRTLEYVKKI